jgi:myo-inositol-1(or 4)-monophosphatase
MHPIDIFQLTRVVQAASSPIGKNFRLYHRTILKDDSTVVTETDLVVHNTLSRWANDQPGLCYIGEEGDLFHEGCEYALYVDPLDGTGAYVRGLASATVAVSLMKRLSDERWEPIMAVIHDPILHWTWGATKDGTSFVQPGANEIGRFPLQVSTSFAPWRVTAVAWRGAPHNMAAIHRSLLEDRRMDHQSFGSTALGGGLIASGFMDALLFGGKSAVETAAMSLIVRSAGGLATDLQGEPLNTFDLVEHDGKHDFLLPNGSIMSSSKQLTTELVRVVRGLG